MTDLKQAMIRRFIETREQFPGQVTQPPTQLELADFALSCALEIYYEDARLPVPQILARVQQSLAKIARFHGL